MNSAVSIFISLLLLSACSAGPKYSVTALGAPTFTNLSAAVLTPQCVRCHNSVNPSSGVSVSTYEDLISSTSAVTPFQPHQSPMYNEFVGQKEHEEGLKLSNAELELIYQWIALGAKND